jgi:hypothetical protein
MAARAANALARTGTLAGVRNEAVPKVSSFNEAMLGESHHWGQRDPSSRKAISPLVYGMNFGSAAQANRVRWPVRRWGGNSVTRYSWELDTHNTARDWFYFNIVAVTAHVILDVNGYFQ